MDNGPSILLDKPILLLGRHPECDIQIDSRKVSRRHCCIAQVSDYLVIRDLGSTNGIRINGVRIAEGRLNEGDELTVGIFRYKVTWDAVPSSDAPSPSPQSPSPVSRSAKGEGPARKRTVLDPSAVSGIEDEMLESCDEPVALDEPNSNSAPFAVPAEPPAPLSPSPGKEKSRPRTDGLDLMPNSDFFRKNAPLPSPSGSHPPA